MMIRSGAVAFLCLFVFIGCAAPEAADGRAGRQADRAGPSAVADAEPAAQESDDPAPARDDDDKDADQEPELKSDGPWIHLFDGESLANWERTNFGGEGRVSVEDGVIHLGMGDNMTGITWNPRGLDRAQDPANEPPARINYEIELEAKRVEGNDFFCGLTFPVGDDPCTLILGGWGGGLIGLSSLDGFDASENDTSSWENFENDRWYHVRLRVEEDVIQAWLDDERIINVDVSERRISIRPEVERSRPLGFATWNTAAELRGIRLRHLDTPDEP